jgi:hypothetical protein
MSTPEFDQKIDDFIHDLQALCAESIQHETSRKKLMDVMVKANAQLEAPVETVWRMIMSVSYLTPLDGNFMLKAPCLNVNY